jgi:hypothetical protein
MANILGIQGQTGQIMQSLRYLTPYISNLAHISATIV